MAGGEAWGVGEIMLKVVYGGKKYCFYFYAFFFLWSLKEK